MASEVLGCKMTREDALEWALKYISRNARKSHPDHKEFTRRTEYMVNKIYDDFEEELKKAYIEGGNDVWKALNCKELAK